MTTGTIIGQRDFRKFSMKFAVCDRAVFVCRKKNTRYFSGGGNVMDHGIHILIRVTISV